jgi:hypothetical protein
MTVTKLIKGKKYRVVRDGCSLSIFIPTSYCSWRYENLSLFIGNVIEYVGKRRGPGHDNVIFNIFRLRDEEGEFEPNTYGSARLECLEEVDNGD